MADSWFNYDPTMHASGVAASSTQNRTPGGELGKDAFLRLLVAQMQFQDPLNPMDNSQMLAQMAQFSALEQMQNVSRTTLQSMAFSMIGKTVEGTTVSSTGETETMVGVVSSILVQNGVTYLTIGDKILAADDITNVYTDPITSINSNLATSQSFGLIGKVVQALTIDSNFNTSGFVEGRVDYVKFSSTGGTILVVGDREIFPSEVVSVGNEHMLIGHEIGIEVQNNDGEFELVFLPVTGVAIRDDKAYLQFDGHEVPIERINFATDALALVGRQITHNGVSGVVSGVILRNDGIPQLQVGEHEISFKDYRNISDE